MTENAKNIGHLIFLGLYIAIILSSDELKTIIYLCGCLGFFHWLHASEKVDQNFTKEEKENMSVNEYINRTIDKNVFNKKSKDPITREVDGKIKKVLDEWEEIS